MISCTAQACYSMLQHAPAYSSILQHTPATEKNKEKWTRSNNLHFRCKTLQDSATKAESLSSPHVHSFESNCIVPAWQLKNKVDIHHTGFLYVTTNVNTILYTTSTQRLHSVYTSSTQRLHNVCLSPHCCTSSRAVSPCCTFSLLQKLSPAACACPTSSNSFTNADWAGSSRSSCTYSILLRCNLLLLESP